MDITPAPFDANLEQYESQAESLLGAFRSGDAEAVKYFHERLPRFLDADIPWLPRDLSDEEIRSAALTIADARLAVARGYDFQSWETLADYVQAVTQQGSPVFRFESAVEAVIGGDVSALEALLREDPELIRARSTRVTH